MKTTSLNLSMFRNASWTLLIVATVFAVSAHAQKTDSKRFNDAIKRSEAAAEVINKLPQLSPGGLPKGLIGKSEAIGIFLCKKTDLVIEHAVICPGVISRRLPSGWSWPAFYRFGAGGFGRPDPVIAGATAVILVFMNEESINWLKDAFPLKGKKGAIAGQLRSIWEEKRAEQLNASLIAYVVLKDELAGRNFSGGTFKGFAVGPDNNINKPLYGIKGHEVLSGRSNPATSIPTELSALREVLQNQYSR